MQELMFDPAVPGCFRPLTKQERNKQRHYKPKDDRVDSLYGHPDSKLFLMSMLDDDEYDSLNLALDSIRHFFYGNRDKYENYLLKYDGKLELYYYCSCYLLDNECWAKLMYTEPLHTCYTDFVYPFREYIKKLIMKEENGRY